MLANVSNISKSMDNGRTDNRIDPNMQCEDRKCDAMLRPGDVLLKGAMLQEISNGSLMLSKACLASSVSWMAAVNSLG